MRIVVMGPSGSGKTAVGSAVARGLDLRFVDGDDLHSAASIAKMSAGTPLTDEDRMPWLDEIGRILASAGGVVIACSALTRRSRDRIRGAAADARFIELDARPATLVDRMRRRVHFMPPLLLDSQLAAWERLQADEQGARVSAEGSIEETVDRIGSVLAVGLAAQRPEGAHDADDAEARDEGDDAEDQV